MRLQTLLILSILLLVDVIHGSCTAADIETMIGGSPVYNDNKPGQVREIFFDYQESTGDLVVSGTYIENSLYLGFIYFVDESLCKIRAMVDVPEWKNGIKQIAFSPHNPHQIYGVG